MYGYIGENECLGWDAAAVVDISQSYAGSCGMCVEVQCQLATITDGYGKEIDRTSPETCRNLNSTVVVRITDTCPCQYSENAYSNKRWCCNDLAHLDLSIWAFEKLADIKLGVIPLRYRAVPCDFTPSNLAKTPNPTPGDPIPSGWTDPKRGCDWRGLANVDAALNAVEEDTYWKVKKGPKVNAIPSLEERPEAVAINADTYLTSGVICMDLPSQGSHFSLTTASESSPFGQSKAFEMWVALNPPYMTVPALRVSLLNDQGPIPGCNSVPLQSLTPVEEDSNGWAKFLISSTTFLGTCTPAVSLPRELTSCGVASSNELRGLRFTSTLPGQGQRVCIDGVRLFD